MPNDAGIQLETVVSGYYGKKVINGISLSITEPSVYVVLGQNGAGKTTLFRTIAGILKPYSGKVTINGISSELKKARMQLEYLSHIEGIPDGMKVEEALRYYAIAVNASSKDVERVISLLNLAELKQQYFSQLSEGQKKRVSISRIFLREKNIYLLDEPTSNLDPAIAREIRDLILNLSKDKIVLYSSHNLFEAREIATNAIVIQQGELSMFCRIDEIKTREYSIGIRVLPEQGKIADALDAQKQGDYYIFKLKGPEEVPMLTSKLISKGVQIREVKEMQNPLEELFTRI